jgi:glycosyltransferase involved in cell wall biosynthesis
VNSNCRILYLLGQLRPGGQERQLYYLLKAMDRRRCQPALAVWNNCTRDDVYVQEIEHLDVPIYACSGGSSVRIKLAELRRLVAGLQPEIIHSYCFYMNIIAWSIARHSKAIPIGSIRQDFTDERWRLGGGLRGMIMGGLSARLPASQIFNSWTAKIAAEKYGGLFKPNHIHVVPNGIDTARVKTYPPVETGYLLAIGRLEAVKRWDRLLKVLSVMSTRGFDFFLRLVGEGPLRKDLESLTRQLGLSRHVEFLGRRQDIPALLRESLFLIHTADAEGCPNVVLEAMAAGRAVVATDAGDVPYLVEDGKTGFVVPRGDDLRLVECIAKLISNPELSYRMGKTGRIKAEQEFGLDRLVSKTLAAYQALGWHG